MVGSPVPTMSHSAGGLPISRFSRQTGFVQATARAVGTPAPRAAKKAIANFKSRTGDTVGYQVTLRGVRMQAFLDKLIHIVFPRVKDFRGIPLSAIDEMGNITLGVKEHTVFPETSDEDAKDVFGLAVTLTTSAKNKKEAEAFLKHAGIPFKE